MAIIEYLHKKSRHFPNRFRDYFLLMITIEFCLSGGMQSFAKALNNAYGDVVERDAEHDGITVERVMIYPKLCSKSQKRLARSGILMRYPDAEATVLICHGFMCDKFDSGIFRTLFPRGKFNFLVFDFRAHGDLHDGQFCTLGKDEKYDVVAAARFIRQYDALKDKPLFVYGFSMGAVSAIEAQAKDGTLFDAMILDCPFDSAENVLKRSLDNVKFSLFGYEFSLPGRSLLQRYAFHPYVQSMIKILLRAVSRQEPKDIEVQAYPIKPVESVKKISVPCFYILCKRDDKVSVDAIQEIFASTASLYKALWITNGRGHFDSYFYNPEKYIELVQQFISACLDGTAQKTHKKTVMRDDEKEES